MSTRVPTLRKHSTGVWFCKWGGRSHYFSKDKKASERPYLDSLQQWGEWKSQRAAARPTRSTFTVAQLADVFLAAKETDTEKSTHNYYRSHTARTLRLWGAIPTGAYDAEKLQALKTDMKRAHTMVGGKKARAYSDQTINHDLIAVKCMFQWGADMYPKQIPLINLRPVKRIPLGLPREKGRSIARVRKMFADARAHDKAGDGPSNLEAWLRLCYFGLLRPSECVRLVARQGRFIEHGVFILEKSKSMNRTGIPRHLVLSDEALMWLDVARPTWSHLAAFGAVVSQACGPGGPHPLRHSAATHLRALGVARADVDLILGHLPRRVSLIYDPIVWQPLRALAGQLKA